jgi:TRAP-type C4-dicarboxylate transport system permease small subunit
VRGWPATIAGFASRLLDGVVCALLLVIVLITLAQVAARYLFGSSFIWSEELTRLLHVWMVMLAAVKASHMRIEFLKDRLGRAGQMALDVVAGAVSLAVLAIMVRYAASLAAFTAGDRYTGLDLSVMYVFLAVVAGGSLWGLAIVVRGSAMLRR